MGRNVGAEQAGQAQECRAMAAHGWGCYFLLLGGGGGFWGFGVFVAFFRVYIGWVGGGGRMVLRLLLWMSFAFASRR